MAKILVADDSPTNRQYLVIVLNYGGHDCLEAQDGAQALELMLTERPDLAIVDLDMPVMDGFELVRRVRGDRSIARTPVIFYTATRVASDTNELADAWGVVNILEKPAEPEFLLRHVAAALAERQTRTGGIAVPCDSIWESKATAVSPIQASRMASSTGLGPTPIASGG